eukprot:gene21320-27624_t
MYFFAFVPLGWKPLLNTWLQSNESHGKFFAQLNHSEESPPKFVLFKADAHHVQALFDWLVEPTICFLRKECIEMSPTMDSGLVMSLLNIFEAMLARALPKYRNAETGADEEMTPEKDSKRYKQRMQDIECCFFFSLIWSIGKSGSAESQMKFSNFLENYLSNVDCIETNYQGVWNLLLMRNWKKPDFITSPVKGVFANPMPMKFDYYDCVYVAEDSKWKMWADMLPQFTIPPDTPYSNIVVPNNYTSQFTYMIELLVPQRKHVLMCGPTGTGKSVYINNTITKTLPQDKFKPLGVTIYNLILSGQQCILFIDDLNMPEVETYGAQPPIELIRQLVDSGGWYDLKEKSWRTIVDCSLIAAMGPAGGGRNGVTPRFLRHFNLLCFAEFDDATLKRIFSTIVNWHFQGLAFPTEVKSSGDAVVDATLDTYRAAMKALLPTPQKSHYTFNLRDFSRIIQGVLLCRPSESFNKAALIRLWSHEALRFNTSFYEVFKHLDKGGKKNVTIHDMRNLIFGDYMGLEDGTNKLYGEVKDMAELNSRMEEFLSAGAGSQPMTFLFSDTQVVFGKAATDMSMQDLYAFFIRRVKQNLHIVLVVSAEAAVAQAEADLVTAQKNEVEITYDRVAKVVAPKKAALAEAEAKLNATMAALAIKKAELQKVEDDLNALQNSLAAAKQKKLDLETQAGLCDTKIVRANQLLDGLGGERSRWTDFSHQLSDRYEKLTGDVLVSSGLLAYLGPFTAVYRQRQMGEWGLVDEEAWFFLLTGGGGMDNKHMNPAPDWLNAKCWDAVCRMSEMNKFSHFKDDFSKNIKDWKYIYDSLDPQDQDFP